MLPARVKPAMIRRTVLTALLVLLLTTLVALQAWRPCTAAASEPTPSPTATPSPNPPASKPSAPPAPKPTPTPTSAPTPASAAAAAAAPPALALTVTLAPGSIAKAGQSVTYAVAVTNTGGQALGDLAVSAVAANLHALTCTPTAQGATLAAGGTTTCRGTRTSTQEDLRTHGSPVSATAVGFAPDGSTVRGTATGKLAVATAPPKATDDAAAATYGRSVVLPASTNDGPAVPGGPAIDPSRTVFKPVYSATEPDQKTVGSRLGDWYVRADGSALFVPRGDVPIAGTDTVSYRVFDSAGQSALGRLTVTTRRGPQAVADRVPVVQGSQVVVHPLTNDRPGQKADGTAGSLVASTTRFSDVQPVGNAVVSNEGSELDIPFEGHLTVFSGEIVLQPVRAFTGSLSVAYSVTDSLGSTASSTVDFTVTRQVPTARNLSLVAGQDFDPRLALFTWSSIDTAPATGVHVQFAGFTGRDGTPLGESADTPQGEWFFRTIEDRPQVVGFDAALGYRGTTSIGYTLADSNGTRATARFTVTVGPGPTTRPDVLISRHGADATIDPGANDTPSPHADGTPGRFNPRFAVFSPSGQPAGSVLTEPYKTLALPGRGRLWFSDGSITFRPQPGFTGDAGTVVYQVEDLLASPVQHGPAAVGRVHLVVTGDQPVATDDTAGTPYGLTVTLPGSTDDDPGSGPGPLAATFPALGQPTGSVVGPGGRSVSVPDEGVWSLLSSGAVTFAPLTGFVGSTSPVIYRITRTDGASDTGTLLVTVAQGIRAGAVSAVRAQGRDTVVDPLRNTVPGYGADGSLGTLAPASVRFPVDGQPLGAVVSTDGRTVTFARGTASTGFGFTVDGAGLVHVSVPSGFRGLTPRVRFTVQGTVAGATGSGVPQEASSTVVVTLTGRGPVAVDDAVTVTGPQVLVALPAGLNDIPASAALPLSVYDVSFPVDQLPGLPKGSTIDHIVTFNNAQWTATVPGEGLWQIDPYTGKAYFEPATGFVGTTTPLRYRVYDAVGNAVDGTLTVTVLPAPALQQAAASGATAQGVPVTVDVANGASGPAGEGASFGGDQPTGSGVPVGSSYRTLVVPGEGTYAIGYGSTSVRFSPVKGFRGTTRPVQVVSGLPQTGLTRTTVTIRVGAVVPVARDDSATTARGVPVRVRLLDNDAAGSPARPLVTSSVRLTTQGLPAGATVSADGQTLSVPGRGSFAVAGDGTVTFCPRAGASGTVPAVGYTVADVNGTPAKAKVTVRVT